MMTLHAGGEFGGGSYAVSDGLHDVGISVVNTLSTRVDTVIRRQGYAQRMSFANGGHPITELVRKEAAEGTGTTQTFYPDPEVLEITVFSFGTLHQRSQQTAFLDKSLHIMLTDERSTAVGGGDEITSDELGAAGDPVPGHHTISHMYEHGLRNYIEYIDSTKGNDVINAEIIDFESGNNEGTVSVEIIMQWATAYSPSVHTFANTVNTTEGGIHGKGFHTALTTLADRYGREKNIIKDKDDNPTGDDIREGLTAVISIKLSKPQFEGQMKAELGNTEARTFIQQQVYSQLDDWFDVHPAEAKAIIQEGQQAQTTRVTACEARKAIRCKDALEPASMPGRLRDCSSRKIEDCEVSIVEGDSAGGSAVGGRDPEHQAIMPIRGKTLNIEKACLDRALSSDTICSLITAFDTGIGESFDLNKLCYDKIAIMADTGVDGQHIVTLLLTLPFRYIHPLIEQGHTYIAMPSLYRTRWTDTEYEFTYSDKERDKFLTAGQSAGCRLPKEDGIQCYKGLGEMNDHELWEITMNPAHRILRQVTFDEAADTDEIFIILIGDDVDRRRSFTQRNTSDVRFLGIRR